MKTGALMEMTRRWKLELMKPCMMECLMQQIRQVWRSRRRDAVAA